MKTVVALSLLAVVAIASPYPQNDVVDPDKGKSRAEIGHITVIGGVAPSKQELLPRFNDYYAGSKRTKVRYGKYKLPSIKDQTLMSRISGEPGTMTSIAINMQKPCETCNLLVAQAGLEYANGTEANLSNGAWLHHIVLLTTGPNRRDSVCAALPGERMFSSGNERTVTAFGDVTKKKVKSAFPLLPADKFQMQLELMNMNEIPKEVYITIDFEYIPGPRPADWKVAKAMWLDVTNCGISSVRPPSGKQQFKLAMRPWVSTFDGELLGVGGHLHDGGVNVNVYLNKKVVCNSLAHYSKGSGMDHHSGEKGMKVRRDGPAHNDGAAHIAKMTTCSMLGPIKKGDTLWIDANYDFNKFQGMKSPQGKYTEVMGIAIMYAAAEPSSLTSAAAPKAAKGAKGGIRGAGKGAKSITPA